jgi:DNA repair protein RecO (recombination protein O)
MTTGERSITSEAIVLRHSDWGEADRLLWLYTRQKGKLRALAKGVRKIRSRKAGHLEPFTRVTLLLARGRDFFIVTQAETVDPHLRVHEDLKRLGYASYIVELLDRFTYEEDENPGLYRLLADTLARLNTETDPMVPVRYYEIRLLDQLGYRPQLFHCLNCHSEIQPVDQFISFSQGGVLCPKCGSQAPEASPIAVDILKYLRHYQRSAYPEAARARLSTDLNYQIEQLMQHYFTYLLERNLNTPAFLRQIKQR